MGGREHTVILACTRVKGQETGDDDRRPHNRLGALLLLESPCSQRQRSREVDVL